MIVKNKNKKVVIAMSGGIDSSVSAALLKRAGFNVIGVFMKFWTDNTEGAENRCCSPESENRARTIASILNIPFYVFDFKKEFKKTVVDYFLKEHKAGRTPNPCVICNKYIKFGMLLEKALKLNADFIATGHYARLSSSHPLLNPPPPKGRGRKGGGGEIKLLKGKDKIKDQSYFLWQLDQKQLDRILFPVGNYTKTEVKKLAKKFKLPFVNIKESMEICFVSATINDFLKKHLKSKKGNIVDTKENILGKHNGLWLYTIGQRKGLGFSGGPYFVLNKNLKTNTLVVTKNQKDLYKKELICKNINWISGKQPKFPLKVKAKIRYQHSPALVTILSTPHHLPHLKGKWESKSEVGKNLKIVFNKPQRAITSGQSVVFYEQNQVLGGGIII
ncbi:MAG: tRNA 2-thiouridine(34) synthase MnmA [Candidatus Pacebacteria bacterium]|nr:tRNA 2-thiouridine(34) synthase MnmA [Candidatus Paceibacterota bacterium]